MNKELYEILRFKNLQVSEREIVFKGNLEPLYPYLYEHKKDKYIILYSTNIDVNIAVTSFKNIKRAAIKDAQYCLIELSDKQIEKVLSLITAINMNIIDILYELYIKDQPLEWRFY